MTPSLIPWIGLLVCCAGGIMIHTLESTVSRLTGLFMAYLGGSLLLLTACSFQTCTALFICGIGSAVLLGTGNLGRRNGGDSFGSDRGKYAFQIILALMLGLISFTLTEQIRYWIPVRRTVLFIALWLFLMSLINLALDDRLLNRCIYLQCICLAFTVVYIYMESSILVFACFAAINLLMAFGSAVLNSDQSADREEEKAS